MWHVWQVLPGLGAAWCFLLLCRTQHYLVLNPFKNKVYQMVLAHFPLHNTGKCYLQINKSKEFHEEYLHPTAFSRSATGISGVVFIWPRSLKTQLGFWWYLWQYILQTVDRKVHFLLFLFLWSTGGFYLHFWMEQTAVCQQHNLLGQELKHNV